MFNDPYLTPGTGCLRNKLNIVDAAQLATLETDIAFARETELTLRSLPGKYDSSHLRKFHKRLFGDIYDWAGKFRTVVIDKGETRFCLPQFLDAQVDGLLSALDQESLLIGLAPDHFTMRLSYYYGELNSCHPFREGNGRTQRAFFRQLAAAAGFRLNWSQLDSGQNANACRRYHSSLDVTVLYEMLSPITQRM